MEMPIRLYKPETPGFQPGEVTEIELMVYYFIILFKEEGYALERYI